MGYYSCGDTITFTPQGKAALLEICAALGRPRGVYVPSSTWRDDLNRFYELMLCLNLRNLGDGGGTMHAIIRFVVPPKIDFEVTNCFLHSLKVYGLNKVDEVLDYFDEGDELVSTLFVEEAKHYHAEDMIVGFHDRGMIDWDATGDIVFIGEDDEKWSFRLEDNIIWRIDFEKVFVGSRDEVDHDALENGRIVCERCESYYVDIDADDADPDDSICVSCAWARDDGDYVEGVPEQVAAVSELFFRHFDNGQYNITPGPASREREIILF